MQNTIRKTIAFPKSIVEAIESIAQKWDMDFADFMRYQAVKVAEENEKEPVYYMSERTEKALEKAEKEFHEGKTKSFKDGTSFIKFLQNKRIK